MTPGVAFANLPRTLPTASRHDTLPLPAARTAAPRALASRPSLAAPIGVPPSLRGNATVLLGAAAIGCNVPQMRRRRRRLRETGLPGVAVARGFKRCVVARGAEERARFAASLAELPSNFIGERAPLELAFSAKCIPHPDKLAKGGEDGFYACPASQSFGVADGVGGWASQGVDPGEFSRSVLQQAYQGIRAQSQTTPRKGAELRDALLKAVDGVLARRLVGGTTVLLGQLNGSELSVLNFGDSGLIVLRPALRQQGNRPIFVPRIVFRTFDQTHYFNCPYQVSSNSAVMEPPDLVHVSVEAGDLIVAGSDGVFDNLFDHEIQGLASQCLGRPWIEGGQDMGPLLEEFAATVAEEAQRNGKRTGGDPVPFGVSASREGLRFSGGKLDDTTVVAAMVVPKASGNAADLCGPVPKLHNFKLG